jgi:NAD-dependent dihydropyrimidine dehydrogenase PreA subunit
MACLSDELLPGKAEIDPDICTGCGECIPVCPNNALEMVQVDY